ncbi:MAG: MSCRAMM family protein [Solirubrobacteraceae bacterium]
MHFDQSPSVKPPRGGRIKTALSRMRWAAAEDAGFALIEILVSAVIVAAISAAVADALISSAHLSGTERQRSQADQLVQQDQERLKGLSDQQLQGLSQTRTVKLDGYTYTVTSNSTFEGTSGASTCTSGSAAYFKVASTVTGQPTGTITDESIIRRTVDGGLRVQVDDQTGVNPLTGVQVSATGPSTATGNTDANGCFVFTGMSPGNYNVGVAAAGYVDKDGNSSPPNISATVAATGIAPTNVTPLVMGQGGSIAASFVTNTATASLTVPGYYMSYFGSLGSSKMSSSVTLGSGAPVASIRRRRHTSFHSRRCRAPRIRTPATTRCGRASARPSSRSRRRRGSTSRRSLLVRQWPRPSANPPSKRRSRATPRRST